MSLLKLEQAEMLADEHGESGDLNTAEMLRALVEMVRGYQASPNGDLFVQASDTSHVCNHERLVLDRTGQKDNGAIRCRACSKRWVTP